MKGLRICSLYIIPSVSAPLTWGPNNSSVPWYHFCMDVAFYLPGRVPVFTFSLLLAVGTALGLLWVLQRQFDKQGQWLFDAGVWSLVGALIGARVAYVVINWVYFRQHFLEIPQVWLGGFSVMGALAGSVIALIGIAASRQQNVGQIADALMPLLTTVSFSAWLGCWVSGSAYGPPTQGWWGVPARDEWGVVSTRWPLQLVAALLILLVFGGVDQARTRGRFSAPGLAASLEVGSLALIVGGVSLLRADPVPQWRGQNLDIWAALGIIVLAILSGLTVILHTKMISRNSRSSTDN